MDYDIRMEYFIVLQIPQVEMLMYITVLSHQFKNMIQAHRENKSKNDTFLFPHLYYVVIGYTFIKMLHVYVCLNTQYSINNNATGVS